MNKSVFYNYRWVEDQPVANRLIEIWPNIIKIVIYWRKLPASKKPSSKSYHAVDRAVGDEFTVAKLSFFSFIAMLLKPYLTKYQTDMPMLPFLGKDLENLHRSLLELIVKPEMLSNCYSSLDILRINLTDAETYMKKKDMSFIFRFN